MAKALRMKDESGQLLPVTNGLLVQYNSSYSVSSYISNLVEEIANTEEATAAALTTLNHKDNVIMAYIDDIHSTYVTYSYLNSFVEREIVPTIPTVDNRLLSSSENPVQNKVIYDALEDVRVTVDAALDASSDNPVSNSVITQTLVNNENTTSQALHGLDTRITQEFDTLSDVTATALTDHENRLNVIERRFNVVDNTNNDINNRITALENYKNGTLTTTLNNLHDKDSEFNARISALEQSLELVNTLLNTIVYGAQEV